MTCCDRTHTGTLRPPHSGATRKALFGASDPKGQLAARTRVGATLETPNFYPYMSGRDNLRVAATIKGVGNDRIDECRRLDDGDRVMSRFAELLRIEFIKARKRPALWLTLGVFIFFTVVTVLPNLMRALQGGGPGPPFALPWIWRAVLQPPINMGPFFLAAAMILLFACSSTSWWRTW